MQSPARSTPTQTCTSATGLRSGAESWHAGSPPSKQGWHKLNRRWPEEQPEKCKPPHPRKTRCKKSGNEHKKKRCLHVNGMHTFLLEWTKKIFTSGENLSLCNVICGMQHGAFFGQSFALFSQKKDKPKPQLIPRKNDGSTLVQNM